MHNLPDSIGVLSKADAEALAQFNKRLGLAGSLADVALAGIEIKEGAPVGATIGKTAGGIGGGMAGAWALGTAGGMVFGPLAVLHRGLRASVGMCILGAFIAVCFAFFYDRSLIKIGRREISYMLPRQRPATADATDVEGPMAPRAESYLGVVSARNHWWVVAIGSCVMAYDVYMWRWTWKSALILAVAVVAAALSGLDDGARSLPIARGQKVQFVIACVASVMMLALPLLVYLAAYFGGKNRSSGFGRHVAVRDPGDAHEIE